MNQRVTDAERVQAIRERADATFAYVLKGSENAATGREVRLAQDIRTLLALLEEAVGLLGGALHAPEIGAGRNRWVIEAEARAFLLRYKGESR